MIVKYIFIFDEDAEQIDVRKIRGNFFIWDEVIDCSEKDIKSQSKWIDSLQRDLMKIDKNYNHTKSK